MGLIDEQNGADAADIPASTDLQESGADTTPENADTPAPTAETPTGDFSSAWDAAKASAATRTAVGEEGEGGEDDAAGDEGEEGESQSDDEIPDDKTTTESEADKASEQAEEATDDKSADDKPKQTDRTRKYNEVIAENERLTTENTATNERIAKLNTRFEKHGGVEAVELAMETFDKLASGKAVEVINELPPHERVKVQKQVFDSAIAVEANRVYALNQVLQSDFGLEKPITKEQLEKSLEYLTHRYNGDAEDFDAFLERELEYANTPERKLARVEAELDRLKAQPEGQSQNGNNGDGEAQAPVSEQDLAMQINKLYDDFEDTTFTRLADAELKDFGLLESPKDTKEMKEVKQTVRAIVQAYVGQEMRNAKAYEALLPFFAAGDTKSIWYNQATGGYERAMKGRIQPTVKAISKLFGKRAAAPPPAGELSASEKGNPKTPAPHGKSSLPPNQRQPEQKPGGFAAAFGEVRKTAGT